MRSRLSHVIHYAALLQQLLCEPKLGILVTLPLVAPNQYCQLEDHLLDLTKLVPIVLALYPELIHPSHR